MPLDYSRSFGGPGFKKNPAGTGYHEPALPNIENPDSSVKSPRRGGDPAGFGPINPAWPPRSRKKGRKYGKKYREERAPYYSVDFDWSYFNAAPEDQQLASYLVGDETLRFQNLHPDSSDFAVELPALRVRAFVNDEAERFREVALNLDTLFVDLDAGVLRLTWRGVDPVARDDLSDVTSVLVTSESLAEQPVAAAAFAPELAAFEADPLGLNDLPEDVKQAIEQAKEIQAAAAEAPSGEAPNAINALMAEKMGGVAPEQQAQVAEAIEGMQESAAANGIDLKAQIAEQMASLPEPVSPPAIAPPPPGVVPIVPLGAELDKVVEAVEGIKAHAVDQGLKPPDAEPIYEMLGDPKLQELDPGFVPPPVAAASAPDVEAKASPAGPGAPEAAAPKEAATPLPIAAVPVPEAEDTPEDEDLRYKDLSQRDFRSKDWSGVDLEGSNLTGSDLTGATLAGANLDKTIFQGAKLTDADLSGANLSQAQLGKAEASGARFDGAMLKQTFFNGANLQQASFSEAEGKQCFFEEADLSGASFNDAQLEQAVFSDAILKDADFSGATLQGCDFHQARMARACFDGAELDKTTFFKARLQAASFVGATGNQAVFSEALIDAAVFRGAVLRDSHWLEVRASEAIFRTADLKGARLDKARISGSDFGNANLFSAEFSRSELSETSFRDSNLYDAKFYEVHQTGCEFDGANTKKTLFKFV